MCLLYDLAIAYFDKERKICVHTKAIKNVHRSFINNNPKLQMITQVPFNR